MCTKEKNKDGKKLQSEGQREAVLQHKQPF